MPQQGQFQPAQVGAPPTAMMPPTGYKPEGLMGGIQHGLNAQKYDQLYKQQQFLNELAMRGEGQRVKEYIEGADYRKDQRGFLHGMMKGAQPHAGAMGSEGAQNYISGKKFERETAHSPDAKKRFFEKMKAESTQEEWQRRMQSMQVTSDLVRQAEQIAQTQGQTAAQAFLSQAQAKAKERGWSLPPNITDPKAWKRLNQIAKDSLEHMREMEVAHTKGRYALGAAAAGGTRARGQAYVTEQLFSIQSRLLADPSKVSNGEKQLLASYVNSAWLKILQTERDKMAYMYANNPQMYRRREQQLKQEQVRFFQQHGLGPEFIIGMGDAPSQDFPDPNDPGAGRSHLVPN